MIENALSPYIVNRQFDIPAEPWAELKQQYDRYQLQDMFADLICDGQVDFPFKEITREQALEKFKQLQAFDNPPHQGPCYFRNTDETGNMYWECGAQYNDVSNYYHQHARMMCASKGFKSPLENWTNWKAVRSLMGGLFTLEQPYVNSSKIRTVIQLRTYIASQFKPGNAKGIYDFFQAERVVDPCSGWGDRLAGFFASPYTKSYFGIDPNTNLTEGYAMQIADYSELAPGKEAVIVCGCAEDPEIPFPECDLVFTSPPYFESEHYSNDPGQSYLQYKTSNVWLENFLFKVVDKAYAALVPGGHMCINIADVISKGKVQQICGPMVEHAQQIGFIYEGCMGMRLSARPNSKIEVREGTYCEQVYVFTKPAQ